MNHLNSLLIEGTVVRGPIFGDTPKGSMECVFSIASVRYYKTEENLVKKVSTFDVLARGRLAENLDGVLKDGRGVRVVGRLTQDYHNTPKGAQQSCVTIIAEHIEMKPDLKTIDIEEEE